MPTNQQRREAAKRKLERQQQKRVQRAQRRKQVAAITAVFVVLAVVAATVAATIVGGSDPPANPAPSAAAPPSLPASAPSEPRIPTQIAAPLTRPTPLPATVSCNYPTGGKAAKPVTTPATANIPARGTVPVSLTTSVGQLGLQLDRALAPCTVNSFVSLAQQRYFDATPCHRLTTSPGLQVLQCGDPTGTGGGGPGYAFADETFPETTYGRGYVAMANAGPNTNGSQFFMIYGDASALSPDYTVFGTISPASLPVLDGVARAGHDGSLDPSPGGGKPRTQVTITSAKVAGR